MASSSEPAHPVVFTTSTPYPLPTQKFMIPTTWKRYQLSQLINKALSLIQPIPFDFLIRGEILRGSLGEWCSERGLGEEETLEVEYIESVMPPQRMSSLPHEDWVSSISCQIPEKFVTASYDGQIRTFSYSQQLLETTRLHDAPITSICVIPSHQSSIPVDDVHSEFHLVASTSHDRTAKITRLASKPPTSPNSTQHSQTLATLHLHTGPISSVSSNPSGTLLLTSGWDGLVGLWDTVVPSEDEVLPEQMDSDRKSKRRKKGANADEDQPKRKAPTQVLKSHTARVSRAVFGNEATAAKRSTAYSCGFDSTVRAWDVESGVCVQTITASEKPLLDLVLTHDAQTALTSSTDRTVTAYDLRSSASSSSPAVATMSHPSLPSCLAIPSSPSSGPAQNANAAFNSHQFVSGAYDGTVRLWDLRSVKSPISSFKVAEGKKILCLDWVVPGHNGAGGGNAGMVGVGGEGGLEVWKIGSEFDGSNPHAT